MQCLPSALHAQTRLHVRREGSVCDACTTLTAVPPSCVTCRAPPLFRPGPLLCLHHPAAVHASRGRAACPGHPTVRRNRYTGGGGEGGGGGLVATDTRGGGGGGGGARARRTSSTVPGMGCSSGLASCTPCSATRHHRPISREAPALIACPSARALCAGTATTGRASRAI